MGRIEGKPGIDYVTQTAARRNDDPAMVEDLKAIVGPLFYVIPTQLVHDNNELVLGTKGQIINPDGAVAVDASKYTDAVITFSASFYLAPASSQAYLQGKFADKSFKPAAAPDSKVKPVFVRNLAVRR
jgi:hypothetical protein